MFFDITTTTTTVAGHSSGQGVSPWVIVIPAVITLLGTVATAIAARYSTRKVNETDVVKLGVTELVDQLRTERTHLAGQLEHCEGDCEACHAEREQLRNEIADLKALKEHYEEEITRLQRKVGEL